MKNHIWLTIEMLSVKYGGHSGVVSTVYMTVQDRNLYMDCLGEVYGEDY